MTQPLRIKTIATRKAQPAGDFDKVHDGMMNRISLVAAPWEDATRDAYIRQTCAFPGCETRLRGRIVSGMCRQHMHRPGCNCLKCVRKREGIA